MDTKRRYTGENGNYATNVDRDSGAYAGARHRVKGFEPDVPTGPEKLNVQVGIDAGQIGDSTAVSISEWTARNDGLHFMVRRLERLPLGLPYPAQADRIVEILEGLRAMSAK